MLRALYRRNKQTDLDAVEVGEEDEERGRDVGRDAEAGDHLERGQVDLRGVVAALEELGLRSASSVASAPSRSRHTNFPTSS